MPLKLLFKPSKTLWTKIKVYSFIVFTSLIIFTALAFFSGFFEVKKITVEGNINKNKIIGLENLLNQNLILLNPQEIKNIIYTNNPYINFVGITKIYPDSLLLSMEATEPLAYLKLNKGFALLSKNGKILEKSEKILINIPVINYYQQYDFYQTNPGSKFDFKDLITALFLLNKSNEIDLKIDSIDINGLSMIVFNLKEQKIYLTGEKSKEEQAFELETLIKQFKIEAKYFKILDLRFDKPIVSF